MPSSNHSAICLRPPATLYQPSTETIPIVALPLPPNADTDQPANPGIWILHRVLYSSGAQSLMLGNSIALYRTRATSPLLIGVIKSVLHWNEHFIHFAVETDPQQPRLTLIVPYHVAALPWHLGVFCWLWRILRMLFAARSTAQSTIFNRQVREPNRTLNQPSV